MESNIADHQYFAEDLQLSEPHFDEEATLLSARPVVPLGDVPPESRSGKRLAFGVTIVVAILAGAFGATLFYQRSGDGSATAIEEKGTPVSEEAVSGDGALSGASGAVSPPQTRSAGQNVSTVNATRNVAGSGSRSVSETKNSAKATSQKDNSGRGNETLQSSPDSLGDDRELRREERIEERRSRRDARREAKRDGREQRRRASDDLLRIREIFEGSPRP